jgi:flagellin
MRINTNITALNAYRNLGVSTEGVGRQIQKLSSGFRINRAADDAAGMAIANKLRAEGKSLLQASRNASQASAMLQIADGAVNTITTILDRMKELAAQANSDNAGTERSKLDAEFQELISEIDRIVRTTKYQGTALVDGTFGSYVDLTASSADGVAGVSQISISGTKVGTYTFSSPAAGQLTLDDGNGVTQTISNSNDAQVLNFDVFGIKVTTVAGYVADSLDGETIVVAGGTGKFMVSSSGDYSGYDLVSLGSVDLSVGSSGLNIQGLDLLSAANAQTALTRIDQALDHANDVIGAIGAAQSRFDFASANVKTILENVQAAESVIRDADMAFEMTQFTKYQILQQAGVAMLAQANQAPQAILALLRS